MPKNTQVPSWAQPGWWYQHVSIKTGGDNIGHLTHESGIGVDISFPVISRDSSTGKILRGMNFYTKVSGKTKKETSSNWYGRRNGTPIDWERDIDKVAFMEFLKYAMPQSSCIIMDGPWRKPLSALITKYAKEGIDGWSLDHPAWKAWRNNGGKCRLSFDGSKIHSNHFHLRLLLPGIAPGPFDTGYSPSGGPGIDKRKGPGRLDAGSPGYVPRLESAYGRFTKAPDGTVHPRKGEIRTYGEFKAEQAERKRLRKLKKKKGP